MGKLNAYLRPSPVGKTKEVFLDNFKDESGKPIPFIVQCISPEDNERISRKYTDKDGNLDSIAYGNELIVTCMVEPDLKNEELCRFFGVMDPTMVPSRMFTIGEKQLITAAVMDINDIKMAKDKLDQAKNSSGEETGK